MPTRRKSVAKAKSNTVKQLVIQVANHLFKNRLTTMVGLSVGVPVIIEGYSQKDWHTIGKGVTDVVLGISGDDKFGFKSTAKTPDPATPPYE